LLGEIPAWTNSTATLRSEEQLGNIRLERLDLQVETNVVVPMLLLRPADEREAKPPVVIGLSQPGKGSFLRERAKDLAELLSKGVAVCLPDVRGTGETSADGSRGQQSEATSISSTLLMLGQTQLGARLRDLRSVIQYLATRNDLDSHKIALWGEAFTPASPSNLTDPLLGEGESPRQSEPLGGLLALLGGLYEDRVAAVVARGTLAGFQSVLRDRYCYVPHDVIVPGALTAGDLCDVAATLSPRPLRLEGLVDGRNCLLKLDEAQRSFQPTVDGYRNASHQFQLTTGLSNDLAVWLVKALASE
jgi:hypothetical protein